MAQKKGGSDKITIAEIRVIVAEIMKNKDHLRLPKTIQVKAATGLVLWKASRTKGVNFN